MNYGFRNVALNTSNTLNPLVQKLSSFQHLRTKQYFKPVYNFDILHMRNYKVKTVQRFESPFCEVENFEHLKSASSGIQQFPIFQNKSALQHAKHVKHFNISEHADLDYVNNVQLVKSPF